MNIKIATSLHFYAAYVEMLANKLKAEPGTIHLLNAQSQLKIKILKTTTSIREKQKLTTYLAEIKVLEDSVCSAMIGLKRCIMESLTLTESDIGSHYPMLWEALSATDARGYIKNSQEIKTSVEQLLNTWQVTFKDLPRRSTKAYEVEKRKETSNQKGESLPIYEQIDLFKFL